MMFDFRKILKRTPAAGLLLVLLCTGCGTPQPDALAAVLERGVLRVGSTGDYRPMSFRNPDTGKYEGFDAALAEDLAHSLGVKLEYVPTAWPALMQDTLGRKFDLALCGITITSARKKQALMSEGYLGNGKTVLCRTGDAEKYTTLAAIDRPDVRVMENPGGLNEKFARQYLPHASLVIHSVNEEIPELIASGKADVMITEIMEAAYYCSRDKRLAAPLLNAPFTRGELGMLIPPGGEALLNYVNGFILRERKSGRLDELKKIYLHGGKREKLIPGKKSVPQHLNTHSRISEAMSSPGVLYRDRHLKRDLFRHLTGMAHIEIESAVQAEEKTCNGNCKSDKFILGINFLHRFWFYASSV